MEYRVFISGVEYGMKDIESASIEQPLFHELGIGNTCSAKFTISFWRKSDIPKMAELIPEARKTSSDQWVQQGVFYIDTRVETDGLMTIEAYDSMLKGEIEWVPDNDEDSFPMPMSEAAEKLGRLIGVELDPRCAFNPEYEVDSYPANEDTVRDVLGYIAAAHAGNWIITAENKLLLIPLFKSLPPDTNYLVTENGDPITFGGTRILIK